MTSLKPITQRLILHWGEMGTKWGINRTVAQIHILLFLSEEPLNAEQIAETLMIARSNVSTSLRELQGWGILKVVQKLGDRRDYYTTLGDVWELFRIIMEERKKREADPTTVVLRECSRDLAEDSSATTHEKARVAAMLDFFETMTSLYEQIAEVPTDRLLKAARAGGKILSLLG